MVLLSRKRMMFVLACVFVSIFVYFVGMENNGDTVQTVNLPVTNKVVVLDAGHGGEDARCRVK